MREPLQVLVLEDEWPARNYLVRLIEQSGLGHVVAAVPSPALATEALAAAPVPIDVAFVDIHLAGERDPSRAGLTWIESLAASFGGPTLPLRLVLTTAYSEHALRAFELGVVDYLLKPFTAGRVHTSLERLAAAGTVFGPRTGAVPSRIAARDGRTVVFLEQEEAFAFEAEGRLSFVHTKQGRLDVDLSLTSLETILGPGYLRVHRNWLVSTAHVKAMERESGDFVLLVGPAQPPLRVQVARDRAPTVRDRLLTSAIGLRRT